MSTLDVALIAVTVIGFLMVDQARQERNISWRVDLLMTFGMALALALLVTVLVHIR